MLLLLSDGSYLQLSDGSFLEIDDGVSFPDLACVYTVQASYSVSLNKAQGYETILVLATTFGNALTLEMSFENVITVKVVQPDINLTPTYTITLTVTA